MRLDELDTEQIATTIKDLDKQIAEIKAGQIVGGASWIFYRVTTGNHPDYTINVPSGSSATYRITFTPQTAELCVSDLMTIEDGSANLTSWRTQLVPTQGIDHSWDIRYSGFGPGTTVITFTVLVKSTQDGTISITRLS